jgi:hypothetical protein
MFNKDDNERDPCLLVIYPQSLQVENPNNSTEDALDSSIDHLVISFLYLFFAYFGFVVLHFSITSLPFLSIS